MGARTQQHQRQCRQQSHSLNDQFCEFKMFALVRDDDILHLHLFGI